MTVANVNVTKVLFKRGNTVQNNNYTGVSGEITIDTQAKTLRIHDGSTVGGNIITATLTGNAGSQQAAIDSLNANVGAYQIYANANATTQTVSINSINANLGAFQTVSNSNAAAQATSINAINANLGAFQSYANITLSTIANAASQESAINSINANVGAYQTFANSNASSQTTEINSLRANITAANSAITSLTSNAAIQAALLDTLTGNAATQSTVLDTLTANAATQATTLTTLLSNAVAQQTSLIDLVANAATQAQAIANASGTYSNTNVAAYLGAFNGNIIPAANVTYSLGDSTHQWKDLWVSNNTIYIGNTPIRVDGGALLVNGAPVATTVANLVNGASTFQLFANGQSRSPDTIFAANGVSIINANGAIQGGIYNSGDADWFNIGASTGRGIKFYVNEETDGPLFFANGSVNVPSNLYSDAGDIGDIGMYGGTISGTNPGWEYLSLINQGEGSVFVQLPSEATANVANLRIHNDIGNVEIAAGDGVSTYNWYFGNNGDLTIPRNIFGTGADSLVIQNTSSGPAYLELPIAPSTNAVYLANQDPTGNVVIRTGDFGSENDWAFGMDGNLTLGKTTPYGGINRGIVWDWGLGQVALGLGAGEGSNSYIRQTENGLEIHPNEPGAMGDGDLRIRTGNVSPEGTSYTWIFNGYGNLTIPDSITMDAGSSRLISVVTPEPGLVSWEFGMDGNLTIPGNINYANGVSILSGLGGAVTGNISVDTSAIQFVASSSGDGNGYSTIRMIPDTNLEGTDQYLIVDPTVINHIHIRAGGTQDNSSADLFLGGENSYVKLPAGLNPNVEIAANTHVWNFNSTGLYGELVLPAGEGIIRTNDDTIGLVSLNTTTGFANTVYLGSGGGVGFFDSAIGGNWLEIFRSGTEPEIRVPVGRGNLNIQTTDGVTPYNWTFANTGNLTLPTGGNLTFDSSAVSTIDGVTDISATGTIGANVIQVLSHITSFGASPAPIISGFSSISTTGYAVNEGNISASGNLVASQNAYVTGAVQAGRMTTGNLIVTGNLTQQSAYYETYANVANSGGNLTCNFVNGGTFYAALTANVTANFTNVALTTGTIVGATIIVDQGATPYQISNVQINGGDIQTVKWAGGVGQNPGTGSNTDVMSFSLVNLGGGAWRVLGAISNYG